MMFNGLLMCNDSDTSEFTKHSWDASGSEGEARASLEESLMAAERALKQKEETVHVQAGNLALSEERPAAVPRTRTCASGCHFNVSDVQTQMQDKRELVKTLQDNLSVMEDLYRECFYETARQDAIIAVLRESCRDRPRQDVAVEVENLKAEICNILNNSTNNDSVLTNTNACGVSTNDEKYRCLETITMKYAYHRRTRHL